MTSPELISLLARAEHVLQFFVFRLPHDDLKVGPIQIHVKEGESVVWDKEST